MIKKLKRFVSFKPLINESLSPVLMSLRDKRVRDFYRFLEKYGNSPRYRSFYDVKVMDYTIDIVDGPSFVWQFKDIFIDEIYKFKSEKESPLIYDVGSNIGVSILYFKMIYPKSRIKGFEPDPKIFEICRRNLERNSIVGVELFNKAAWVKNGKVKFCSEGSDAGFVLDEQNKTETDKMALGENIRVITVETIRLKEYIEGEKEKIDFLKLDIEGGETEVLIDIGESITKCRNVFVEFHSFITNKQNLSTVLKIFENYGFRYYIYNQNKKYAPLVNTGSKTHIDLLINIWAWKD